MSDAAQTKLPFRGFMIGGYRSFYGQPQEISPLGKVTLLAGPNNSGKSNILVAASKWLPMLRMGHRRNLEWRAQLGEIDTPILRESVEVPPFSLGVATSISEGDPVKSLLDRIPGRVQPGTNTMELIERIARSIAPRAGSGIFGDDLIWFRWQAIDNQLQRDADQMKAIAVAIEGREDLLRQVCLDLFQESSSQPMRNIARFLDAWEPAIEIPDVISIPSSRRIISDGPPSVDLRDNSGVGLPGMLQALQSPSAGRYREDRQKFQRINVFMREVLEDSSVEVIVPYDSKTVHISIGDRVLPLENLGAGLSQLLLFAVVATWHTNKLINIEEPETNLNPIVLRKLVRYLREETSNQYLISTHSPNMLDDPSVTVLQIEYEGGSGTSVVNALTPARRAAVAQHLGYRPSDLIQCNAIIWVEGPSDRIYLNNWIAALAPNLMEGAHYSIMFYGGRLLAHLSGQEVDLPEKNVDDFISLLPINRRMVIVIDSDKSSHQKPVNATKRRIEEGFLESGGIPWITAGREIENYVPVDVFETALKLAHPSVNPRVETSQYADRFDSIQARKGERAGRVSAPDKVRVAEEVVKISPRKIWDILDLQERVESLVEYINKANHMVDGAGYLRDLPS